MPSAVRRTAIALRGRVRLYVFISSTSVFGDDQAERSSAYSAARQQLPGLDAVPPPPPPPPHLLCRRCQRSAKLPAPPGTGSPSSTLRMGEAMGKPHRERP